MRIIVQCEISWREESGLPKQHHLLTEKKNKLTSSRQKLFSYCIHTLHFIVTILEAWRLNERKLYCRPKRKKHTKFHHSQLKLLGQLIKVYIVSPLEHGLNTKNSLWTKKTISILKSMQEFTIICFLLFSILVIKKTFDVQLKPPWVNRSSLFKLDSQPPPHYSYDQKKGSTSLKFISVTRWVG